MSIWIGHDLAESLCDWNVNVTCIGNIKSTAVFLTWQKS